MEVPSKTPYRGSRKPEIVNSGYWVSMYISGTFAFQVQNCPLAIEDAGKHRHTLFDEGYVPVPCVTPV